MLKVQPKNNKLGNIWNISLPAVKTCGGMTESCAGEDGKCYVLKIYRRRPNVLKSHEDVYAQVLQTLWNGEDFELPAKVKDVMRIHVAGDFFSPAYGYAWVKLITNNPDIKFFAYTRSWSMVDMYDVLHELNALPNMELLLSVDRDTGYPNSNWDGFRTAFMMVDNNDIPLVQPDTHVVFRDSRNSVMKQVNGNLVCPTENGISKTTCEKCKWCFKDTVNKTALNKKEVTYA